MKEIHTETVLHKRRERFRARIAIYAKLFILLDFVGLALAIITLYLGWVKPIHFILFLTLFVLTELGITLGFHRLFSHRAFVAKKSMVYLFGILGCMAAQGPILYWVSAHRQHHQHSDQEHDPHSPVRKGFWYAHIGWMLEHDPVMHRNLVRDLKNQPEILWMDRHYLKWLLLGFALPTLAAGLYLGSWQGAVLGFIWGGLFRMFAVHQCTWAVNSICHLFGHRAYHTHDSSRNNVMVAVFTMGEGWHNNHHAYPRSARQGLRWWQWDPTYYCIWVLQKCGLVKGVRLPNSV
jgi:stearoyl-CoA desaturase (delta-9 desaturase)